MRRQFKVFFSSREFELRTAYLPKRIASGKEKEFVEDIRSRIAYNARPTYGVDPRARDYSCESTGVGFGRSRVSRNPTLNRAVQASGTRGGRRVRAPISLIRRKKINKYEASKARFLALGSLLDSCPVLVALSPLPIYSKTRDCLRMLEYLVKEHGIQVRRTHMMIVSEDEEESFRGFQNICKLRRISQIYLPEIFGNSGRTYPSVTFSEKAFQFLFSPEK